MTTLIAIPVWLFVLMAVLTLWSVFSRALFPGVRWFFRRRINRVIDEIAIHLDIEIRPFQLTKRQVLIDRLAYDPKVMEAIQTVAEKSQKPRELLQAEVMTYAREIVPSFNAYLYFRVGYWLAKKIARMIYMVRVGRIDDEKLAEINADSTVVFVMNHRSNMDYILVAFLAMERTALSYAVGEWARIWPLQTLIRAMGAFFVRRNSRNPLYRQVLERYIHMATREGVCQAVFLEGGLSRDGNIRPPRFGLVDYMLRSFDPDTDRDIVFIPVGINYDRTIEDRSLLRRLEPDSQKRSLWFVVRTTLGFILRNVAQMVTGKWRRFGYACVNFGDPVFTAEFCRRGEFKFKDLPKGERFRKVETFCNQLTQSISQVIPVLPVALVSRMMLANEGKSLDLVEIRAGIRSLIEDLTRKGAPIYYPKRNFEKYIEMALEMMKLRHMLLETEGVFRTNPEMTDILSYYANSISHW
ncbi:MAG: 1-acyl-sn-glycerol-3-phosphate acyltransferase [bacterium]